MLDRLRGNVARAWHDFVYMYTPLVCRGWDGVRAFGVWQIIREARRLPPSLRASPARREPRPPDSLARPGFRELSESA